MTQFISKFKILVLTLFFIHFGIGQVFSTEWSAKWIWQAADGPANTWMTFRKVINVSTAPQTAIAHIGVDSKYWLWINGELVKFEGGNARGPAPGATWYDDVDIKPYLKQGDNTIAILAWYWGRETFKGTHVDSKKGGLIFQAEIDNQIVISDNSWKAKAHLAYDANSGGGNSRIVPYNVFFDANKSMGDWSSTAWCTVGFNDSSWGNAIEKGSHPTLPWGNLEKSTVNLIDHGLENYVSLNNGTASISLPFTNNSGSTVTIYARLPFNMQVTPYLDITTESNKIINISVDNPNNFITAKYTSKSGNQQFEAFSWMSGPIVKYEIPTGVTVNTLKYRWTSIGNTVGNFECSDPFFQRLWWMGRNTIFVCSRDNFMDCPDRERSLWIGDVSDQASYLFYTMDENGRQLLKKAIKVTLAFSIDGSVIAGQAPGVTNELPTQSLQFISQGIWQYYMNTGDAATLDYAYSYVKNYLNLWNFDNTKNLIIMKACTHERCWDWCDWDKGSTIDKLPIFNALYYYALNSAKKMAETLNKPQADIDWYNNRINRLKTGFTANYWKGEFYSTDISKYQDDRTNALAIITGLADSSKYKSIVEKVLIPNHFCSPHFEWMVEDAMCIAGYTPEALARMKARYQSQVDGDFSTLNEYFTIGEGTFNHAWNAPNTILSKNIAGIEPVEAGWSKFKVFPKLTHLKSLKQIVSTVKGNVAVDINSSENQYQMNLTSPAGAVALVGIPKASVTASEIKVNNNVVWQNGVFVPGTLSLTNKGENADYIWFELNEGNWSVIATSTAYFVSPSQSVVTPGSDLVVKAGINVAPESIQSMALYINNVLVSSLNQAPFEWGNIGNENLLLKEIEPGSYNLKLVTTVNGVEYVINKSIEVLDYAYISSPKDGELIEAHGIEVSARLNPDIVGVSSLALLIDDKPVRTITAAPFEWGKNYAIDAALMDLSEGVHKLTLITTKNNNKTFSSSILVTIKHPIVQLPFGTLPIEIPGIIEAENYDLGGEGISYHDSNIGNTGGVYRTDDVDIGEFSPGLFNIGWSVNGEWLEYTINVAETGIYDVGIVYSAGRTTPAKIGLDLSEDGTVLFSNFNLPVTGNWSTYTTLTKTGVQFTAGKHILRLNISTSGCNIDKLVFSKAGTLNVNEVKMDKVNVFPNPSADGQFHLSKFMEWQVYTIDGAKILEGEGTKIDLSAFQKGIYIGKAQHSFLKLIKK